MKLEINKDGEVKNYQLPDNWETLSLRKYIRLMKVLQESKKDDEFQQFVNMISILSDVPRNVINKMQIKDIKMFAEHIGEFLNNPPDEELKHFLTVDNIEYGFNPNLREITFGEWVDIDTYLKDGVNDNLHKILSVLYRPVIAKDGDKYRIADYEPNEKVAELFLDELTVGDFYGASVFFSDLGRELLTATLKYSIQEMKDKRNRNKVIPLKKSGVGTE